MKHLLYLSLIFLSVNFVHSQEEVLTEGKGNFIYNGYEPLKNKPIPIYYYNPSEDPAELPILFVMHGTNRNADDYRDNWVELAEKHQVLVIVPEFSKENFSGADNYNLGGMFTEKGNQAPEEQWAYSLIEPIFDYVKEVTGNQAEEYDIFGHSAGSQFVHRFAMFKQGLRARKIISANAGWYTMPNFEIDFPYGLGNTSLTEEGLKKAFGQDIVILLGEEDNDPNGRNLRRTPEAIAQGPHRFARGHAFYRQAQLMANKLKTDLNWSIQTVPGVAHSNAEMAIATAEILYAGEEDSPSVKIEDKYSDAIKRIANSDQVKKAFQTIVDLDSQTVENQILLTEIPAPPFKEEVRARKFAEMMKAAGADSVWIDNVGNVIAKRNGLSAKRTVVVDGHLDTVFPEGTNVQVVKKGDTLYAPGIGDDTRALAVMITLLKAMEKNNIQTQADVLFTGTVGEEGLGDLRGVKNLFSQNGPGKIDAFIAIDGGDLGRIVHRGLGSIRYRITFTGPGGHSWGAFGLANPHNALGRAISYWTPEAEKLAREDGAKVSYNVGTIGGGTSVNSIPFESWMEIDMRSEDPNRLQKMDDLLQAAVRRALEDENNFKQAGKDLELDIEMIGNRPSGEIDPTSSLVQHTMAATEYLGGIPRLTGSSTNANTPISQDIPAVTIGKGGKGGQAHSLNEWWINKEGHLAAQKALLILLSESGYRN